MIAVDANTLTAAASQYQGITGQLKELVKIALLAQLAGAPYSTMTAQQLIALAGPYQAIDNPVLAKQVEIALLAQIAQTV